ncbi:Starch-binding associating with outer membrane [Filimonas lacunae]|uniref:Starch-binding associating with outer membrane n=1 Tax=Filimonas lacunae TaxID=477680 RepID=A0A173MRJ9_9BACT|nr:RagB/SusD family nutrient uptake outer membrane protein [Filimonas lacunae]BAV10059.1 outer membrane protein SusD [Filimonas lacunae]SIS83359.1 Starch-binding associating with outer membrane [Filimonas lacunae]
MKKNLLNILGVLGLLTGCMTSCTKDLNRNPTNGIDADSAYGSVTAYKGSLAKAYAAFALTSSEGSDKSDLGGIDAGTSDFIRLYWNAQELSTDEAMCVWTDPGVPDFHNLSWTSANTILRGLYTRSIYQITVCNDFIKQSTDDKLASRNITGNDAATVKYFRAEARFLRAYQYWVLMDMFANPPYVTEASQIGTSMPPQIQRADLFKYVESELLAVDSLLMAPRTNEYGRADQAAAWALQARLYLNAGVYTGTTHYPEAMTYANKVINAGYSLMGTYGQLFMADNNVGNNEIILSINYDGNYSQNYGGTTFLVNSAINADMNPTSFGVPNGGWGGNRTTSSLPDLFAAADKRAMFYGTSSTITDVSKFEQGKKVIKYRNLNKDSTTPASTNGVYTNVDFPLFRLGEMYLTYAEAALRAGTNTSDAINYINVLRQRAFGNTSGNVTSFTVDNVLDERARELFWECTRRTDLIRYGKFTTSTYLWPWKGGVSGGKSVDAHFNIYPIPSSDIIANTNLKQNTGY